MITFLPVKETENNGIVTLEYEAFDPESREKFGIRFSVDGMNCTVESLDEYDSDLFAEGLIRTALSVAGGRGAYFAKVNADVIKKPFMQLGFKEKEDGLYAEIPDIFSGTCSCN